MVQYLKAGCVFALTGLLFFGIKNTAYAEEVTTAGYHVYDVQDTKVSDTWYGIGRGNYLQAGISELTHGKKGYALCDGYTLAHFDCDRVYLRIYLDESDNGTDGWGTVDYWTGIAYNDAVATMECDPYKITSGKYYRAKGVHSVTQDGYTETTGTCTDALLF